ncbi:hypothetical protein Kisp01_66060 [Kineosporia sp. NBRC 101677]|uniref:matrixin family metalloprotease n=1 Tax=Kineosporia sp. NBRC 101677 TaxID=3032197 RepID=UPI0024A0D48C|nr:matrixin family metalloprotease [Kineosporia sp. NBRC 101677]GLY19592.1 hypothetical protein Kisp01_66060 [Kineosporia sp. NBRC 101677]
MPAELPDLSTLSYLERYGYLPPGAAGPDLDVDTVAHALARFQDRMNVPVTGRVDADTRSELEAARCGMPDLVNGLALKALCPWDGPELRYAFGAPCTNYEGAFEAVERAASTWAGVLPFVLRRVESTQEPDVMVEWRPAQDPDHSMVGTVVAHADFPGPCWTITEAPPKPLHFDDDESIWADGAIRGAFDVETVALHEFGHLLGLAHTQVPGAVMYPRVRHHYVLRELQPDDLDQVCSLYPASVPT